MIRQAPDERSFHIFYQLIAGTNQEQKSKTMVHGAHARRRPRAIARRPPPPPLLLQGKYPSSKVVVAPFDDGVCERELWGGEEKRRLEGRRFGGGSDGDTQQGSEEGVKSHTWSLVASLGPASLVMAPYPRTPPSNPHASDPLSLPPSPRDGKGKEAKNGPPRGDFGLWQQARTGSSFLRYILLPSLFATRVRGSRREEDVGAGGSLR